MKQIIHLFMWGYQPHFRILIESCAKAVFKEMGIDVTPKVLLVGARAPEAVIPHPVCVEPEDGEWPITLFSGLLEEIELEILRHPGQNMFYGDERSMREKPENIRRDSVTKAVRQKLLQYDEDHEVRSFCGYSYPVENYYIVTVIQVPNIVFENYPPLKKVDYNTLGISQGYRSLIHACLYILLNEATNILQRPDPGRLSSGGGIRRADEIVREAASSFMRSIGMALNEKYAFSDLFERFNVISSLMYEGAEGIGQLILVDPDNPVIDYLLRFQEPVPFRESRWARKTLEMATKDIPLIADSEFIFGLGKLNSQFNLSTQNVFVINFIDHYHWELRCGNQLLLQSHYAKPKLHNEVVGRDWFTNNYLRLFPDSTTSDQDLLWRLFETATRQNHGSMIIVARDAEAEAKRLSRLGTCVEPTLMTEKLFKHVSGIDGAIILDPHGYCYAVGVILDGVATSECTPSRGSRYNSGLRYVQEADFTRLAIVISDDKTFDIIPALRPQILRGDIEKSIIALEMATLENYHKPRKWLDEHRFYLNAEECGRVNLALDRIEKLPREFEIVISTKRFEPDIDMNESYFITQAT